MLALGSIKLCHNNNIHVNLSSGHDCTGILFWIFKSNKPVTLIIFVCVPDIKNLCVMIGEHEKSFLFCSVLPTSRAEETSIIKMLNAFAWGTIILLNITCVVVCSSHSCIDRLTKSRNCPDELPLNVVQEIQIIILRSTKCILEL